MTETCDGAARVEPRIARGMQDLPASREAARLHLVEAVRRAYESHGFTPLATPVAERLDVLLGSAGAEVSRQVFRVDPGDGEPLGMRFDLTVPLARHVAANAKELPRPFRRYQVGAVYRADKPGPGRFREFIQMDADIVGTTNPLADAEIVSALHAAFRAAVPADASGPRHRIRMSDRRILDALLASCGIPRARGPDVLRVLDKLERIGRQKLALELQSGHADESGDPIPGLGLADDQTARVLAFLEIGAATRQGVLAELSRFLADAPGGGAAVEAVAKTCAHLDAFGLPDADVAMDVSIARGLAYYTGSVFEVALRDATALGSVAAGGRYDDLVGRFLDQPWPGVGASVGIDRLLAALEAVEGEARAPSAHGGGPQVLVTVMDAAATAGCIALARELREAGLRTEIYCGDAGGFGRQLKHADRRGVAVAVIAGPDEIARGTAQVKWLLAPGAGGASATRAEYLAERRGQLEVKRADVVQAVRDMLVAGALAP